MSAIAGPHAGRSAFWTARVPATSVPARAWPAVALSLAGVFTALADERNLPVLLPLFATLSMALAFYWVLWSRRYPQVPWFEAGAVYVAVVTLYTAYPLTGYLILGQTYTPLNDSRLFRLQPDAGTVARIAWLHVAHLAGFALAYCLLRGRLSKTQPAVRRPGLPLLMAVVLVYLAIEAFAIAVGLFYGAPASSYLETYLVARRLPLILGQLMNHLTGMKYVLVVMLLAALFSRYPRSRPILIGWIALAALLSISRLGSRTELVLLLLAAAMMYHLMVRPFAPRWILAAGGLGLTGFLGFGLVRSFAQPVGAFDWNVFAYTSEFENLFANAVHLASVKDAIGALPASFYFADLAALVPQQIAPFTKIDRADWYVSTFFPAYASRGGGLAFGTIAEAVLSGGWPSALLRGGLIGVLLAAVHRGYSGSRSFWMFVFYVWVTTLSYQLYRNGTLALLVMVVFRFLPAVLVVSVLTMAIRRTVLKESAASARGAP